MASFFYKLVRLKISLYLYSLTKKVGFWPFLYFASILREKNNLFYEEKNNSLYFCRFQGSAHE